MKPFLVLALVIAIPVYVAAQEVGVAAHAGSLGLGADVAVAVGSRANLRASAHVVPLNFDVDVSDVAMTIDPPSPAFRALLDVFPFGGGFRLSGGLLYSPSDVELVGNFTGAVDIGDDTYTAADVGRLTGTITTNEVAPYLGIGLGDVARGGFGFFLDLGVAFQGKPSVTLDSDGPVASLPEFQADLRAEEQAAEEDSLMDLLKYYPVLSLGFSLGF